MKPLRKTFLVAGGAGFLGSHVVRILIRTGRRVFAGVRAGSNLWRLAGLNGVEITPFDLTQPSQISDVLARIGPDVVINCAAYGVSYDHQDAGMAESVNATGAEALCRLARDRNVHRLIHVGTAYEYGSISHDDPIAETAVPAATSLYGKTKRAGSDAVLNVAGRIGLDALVVRPFGFYGPMEESGKFAPQLISALIRGETLALSPGHQVRDYTYVADVALAIARLCDLDPFPAGEILNLGSGRGITLRGFADAITAALEKKSSVSGRLDWGGRPYRDDEVMTLVSDTRMTDSILGPIATTSLEAGLDHTIESYLMGHDQGHGQKGGASCAI